MWGLRWSSVGSRALAAGVSWTSRTTSAPWGYRSKHTSVVDAAGAIYVIGGYYKNGNYGYLWAMDVWASTDGGARPDSRRGWSGGTGWVPRGTRGTTYWRGIKVYEGGF